MSDSDTTRYPATDPSGPPPSGPTPGPSTPPVTPTPPPPPPAWRPPAADPGRNGALIFGAVILVVGLWFFATNTLGLDLPDLDWGELWPIVLIGLGAWIVLNAIGRRSS